MNPVRWIVTVLIVLSGSYTEAQSTLDLANDWLFRPDRANIGETEKWFSSEYDDKNWVTIQAGKRWEDQGYADVDQYAWYRKWINVPASWRNEKVWLVLGAVNDNYVLYCNGKQVNSFGDETDHSVADIPTVAELSRYLQFGERNLIAMRVFDWGDSGGLWRSPCLLSTDASNLDILSFLACYVLHEKRELLVEANLTGLGNIPPEGKISIKMCQEGESHPISERELTLQSEEIIEPVTFNVPKSKRKVTYRVTGTLSNQQGEIVITSSANVKWPAQPSWPDEYGSLKILNNFVTEILNIRLPREDKAKCE
ncbi:MAG: sugar-binding domain-containing protein, partial [bacterium]